MRLRVLALAVALVVLPFAVVAQPDKAKAKAKRGEVRPPDAPTKLAIDERLAKLRDAIDGLKAKAVDDALLVEVEIYAKAAVWIARHNEYYDDQARQTVAVLDHGLERATQGIDAPWRKATGKSVVRAYRSKVDGSVQPYAVTLPANYPQASPWRLDVVLHGRDGVLTEVKFLNSFQAKPAPKAVEAIRLDIFGRTNNAYRWAGETDVFEAMASFLAEEAKAGRPDAIDRRRVVLHGFSMGGAGSWHLGLHHPSKWATIGPGAGFTTTKGYTKLPEPLPEYVEKCLRIYDAFEYAENARMVPVVAYGGEKDPQLKAAKNVEARLKPLGIPMVLFVAPDTEHKLIPEYEAKMEAEYHKHAGLGRGRLAYPERVQFVTHTLKYNRCDWVELLGLERHYDKASVDAYRTAEGGYTATTANVSRLRLDLRARSAGASIPLSVDGSRLTVHAGYATLEKTTNGWRLAGPAVGGVEKSPGLQGPIDDAFTGGFLCVRGTGPPRHPAVHAYAMADLERFRKNWNKYLRGELTIKDDTAVTDEDLRTKHLILFGDPRSNMLIAELAGKTPLTWGADRVQLGGASGDAATTVPVLIHPNPRNPTKYVVLNSGHTFHADAFQGTNALLYPRLGDFALLEIDPSAKERLGVKVLTAGLFDEQWKAPHSGKP